MPPRKKIKKNQKIRPRGEKIPGAKRRKILGILDHI